MAMWMLLIRSGVLYLFLFSHVKANVFQGHFKVTWFAAKYACHFLGGTLFKPNETAFDVSLFRDRSFDDDLWVAATFTDVNYPETQFAFSPPDTTHRCMLYEIQRNCEETFRLQACTTKCNAICVMLDYPYFQYRYETPMTWSEASIFCLMKGLKLAREIQKPSTSLFERSCEYAYYWTWNVIQAEFQSGNDPRNNQEKCGVLHDHLLDYHNCNRELYPLCERDETSSALTRFPYSSVGMSSDGSVVTNTQAWRATTLTSQSNIPTSTTIKQPSTTTLTRKTVNGLFSGIGGANVSTSTPVVTYIQTNFSVVSSRDEVSTMPGISTIAGSAVRGVVFLVLAILLIAFIHRRLSKRYGRKESTEDTFNMKTNTRNTAMNIIYSQENGDVPSQALYETATFGCTKSHLQPCNSDMLRHKLDLDKADKSIFSVESDDFEYAKIKTKANTNTRNENTEMDNDSFDHMDALKENRHDNLTENIYDIAKFHLGDGCICRPDNMYDTAGEFRTAMDKGDGVYDRVQNPNFAEYDTTYVTEKDRDSTYDHV